MQREHQIKKRGRGHKLSLIDTMDGDPLEVRKEEQDD